MIMADRERRLNCKSCKRLFWERFEFKSLARLREMAHITNCEYCYSDDWVTTAETRIKYGDIGYRDYQEFICKNCDMGFYVKVSGRSGDELAEMTDMIECPSCQSLELRLGGDVFKRTIVDDYSVHILHPFGEKPDNTDALYD